MNNQECKERPEIINGNSNNPIFYPFSVKTSRCRAFVIIFAIHMQKFAFPML